MTAPLAEPRVAPNPHPGMGFKEFVALIALLMAMNALAIDSMLPALPQIGEALGVANPNSRQWIVTAYLLGFGVAQIVYGPLADRYGRRPVLLAGVAIYVVFSLAATLATSFQMMIAARVLQGVGAATSRVLAVSIVRDCYSGRTMARVMSLSFLVFLGVPIIAPSVGQAIVLLGPWRAIFGVLGAFGAMLAVWAALRLPETLHPDNRLKIEPRRILSAFAMVLKNRTAIGYTLASTAVSGTLFGFINSSQQLFADVFHQGTLFPLIFAMIAAFIAAASITNATLVERLGTRLISHAAILGFTALSAVHLVVTLAGWETIWTFSALQCAIMFCFGLTAGNFGAMAMQPVGHIAGTASSLQGFISTIGGALAGFFIGQHFDGSATPMAAGFTVCGVVAVGCVLFAERGRLFRSREAAHSRRPPA